MSSRKNTIITIEGEVHHETDAAYFFSSANDSEKVWVPKSLCEWDESDNTMQMPKWLAVEKDLI